MNVQARQRSIHVMRLYYILLIVAGWSLCLMAQPREGKMRAWSGVVNNIKSAILKKSQQGVEVLDRKLIITTVDGVVHMVDARTGDINWSYETGAPVISSRKMTSDYAGLILPSTDGSIVHFTNDKVHSLNVKAQDIVRKSPFLSSDGKTLFTGSKRSTLFAVSATTGNSKMTLADQCPQAEAGVEFELGLEELTRSQDSSGEFEENSEFNSKYQYGEESIGDHLDDAASDHTMWISRTDHSVRAFNSKTQQQQLEFTYSEVKVLSQELPEYTEKSPPLDMRFAEIAASDTGVLYFHHEQDHIKWKTQFETQVVSVSSPSANQNFKIKRIGQIRNTEDTSNRAIAVSVDIVSEQNAPDSVSVNMLPSGEPYAVSGSLIDSKGLVLRDGRWEVAGVKKGSEGGAVVPYIADFLTARNFDDDGPAQYLNDKTCNDGDDVECLVGLVATNVSTEAVLAAWDNLWVDPFVWIMMILILILAAAVFFLLGTVYRQHRKIQNSGSAKELQSTSVALPFSKPRRNSQGYLPVGALQVSEEILGYGSHGTVVFTGLLGHRPVAIKRMLKHFHANMEREIQLLIDSDGHPNVVRYYAKEIEGDFVYLALELCKESLAEAIIRLQQPELQDHEEIRSDQVLDPIRREWLRELASGVAHLHGLKILHRDLKPHNILIADEKGYPAPLRKPKISDMGLGKKLEADQSSFGHSSYHSTRRNVSDKQSDREDQLTNGSARAPGSVGWQAPEVLVHRGGSGSSNLKPHKLLQQPNIPIDANEEAWQRALASRKTAAVDIFSLGCIFYTVLAPGKHPFGEWFDRERNIVLGHCDLSELQNAPAMHSLVSSMVANLPLERPTAAEVVDHPAFWDEIKCINFLQCISDRMDREDRSGQIFIALESISQSVIGSCWDTKLDRILFESMSRFRRYSTTSLVDLLRLMRNVHHHYHELSVELQESRFPIMVMACYNFVAGYLPGEKIFSSYLGAAASRLVLAAERRERELLERGDMEPIWSLRDSGGPRGWWPSHSLWVTQSFRRTPPMAKESVPFDERYKTTMCLNWKRAGPAACKFGPRCSFAHGVHELRLFRDRFDVWGSDGSIIDALSLSSKPFSDGADEVLASKKLKTKVCGFYSTSVGCREGDKCRFIHIGVDENPLSASGYARTPETRSMIYRG